jgi:hypothetical protein
VRRPPGSRRVLDAARATLLICVLGCGAAAGPAVARLQGSAHQRRHSRQTIHRQTEGGCPIFPADNALNQEVAALPRSPHSQAYVESIGLTAHLRAAFGHTLDYGGMPYEVVGPKQPKVPVRFTAYRSQSNRGPYPIPADAVIEGGGNSGAGDKHVLVLQEGSCRDYELYNASRDGRGGWTAFAGAVFNLRSNALRRAGWTSADAAGLPILPLLARYQEVSSGVIDHALRMTVPDSQRGYIHPATHSASSSSDSSLPPMGLRLRLQASYPLAGFSGQALVILRALKRYGLIVADNGSPWVISGAPSPGWNEASIGTLKRVPGSAFEAVETGRIIH